VGRRSCSAPAAAHAQSREQLVARLRASKFSNKWPVRIGSVPCRAAYLRESVDFRGLRHEPVNEQGVVVLFGMIARELGFLVEALQAGYPDCEAKRQIGPGKWQRVRIEFEYESRNFRDHGHALDGCDVIVCWRHNWVDCPTRLGVLALSEALRTLSARDDAV